MNEEKLVNDAEELSIPEPTIAEPPAENDADNDYEAIIESDLRELREKFPELSGLNDITELENPVRYGALRDLGLSPEEAYRATTPTKPFQRIDNRSHLRSSAARSSAVKSSAMSYRELEVAREIFSGVPDSEIQRLYKKVTR